MFLTRIEAIKKMVDGYEVININNYKMLRMDADFFIVDADGYIAHMSDYDDGVEEWYALDNHKHSPIPVYIGLQERIQSICSKCGKQLGPYNY